MNLSAWQQFLIQQLPDDQLVVLYDYEEFCRPILASLEQQGWHVREHTSYFDTLLFYERWLEQSNGRLLIYITQAGASLPPDIRDAGTHKHLQWEHLFSGLNRDALLPLDPDYWPQLWAKNPQGTLHSYTDTILLALGEIFGCYPERMNTVPGFVRSVVRLHYRGLRMPESYAQQLVQLITAREVKALGPLELYLLSGRAFMQFMQAEWQKHVAAFPVASGTTEIPFDDHDLRAYVDNLFVEGFLQPTPWPLRENPPAWMKAGVIFPHHDDDSDRVAGTIVALLTKLPAPNGQFAEWSAFAQRYGKLLVDYSLRVRSPQLKAQLSQLQEAIDRAFTTWMKEQYGLQQSRTFSQHPYLVSQVAPFLKRRRGTHGVKMAIVVLDALSWDAWASIREDLLKALGDAQAIEAGVLAQVPTVTSISRQAIFAGKPPAAFSDSLFSTHAEDRLWKQFWQSDDSTAKAAYCGVLAGQSGEEFERVKAELASDVLGLVVRHVDDTVHGSTQGLAGIHSSLKIWLQQGWLSGLLTLLLDSNFEVYITADHGYVSATGQGTPNQGVLVSKRGQRSRMYNEKAFLGYAKQQFADSIEWENNGLPKGYYCLLAPGRKAFMPAHEVAVVHGGISLEETMVPFVHIRRKQHE